MKLLNPIEQRLAAGMSPLAAFLTDATCGEACWEAREEVCRCSCGGKNHGCMRTADGVRPTRNAKIDGFRYELKAIGSVYMEARAINQAAPKRHIGTYEYYWCDSDKGAPARVKSASDSQIENWQELASYRENRHWTDDQGRKHYLDKPYLLWVRVA